MSVDLKIEAASLRPFVLPLAASKVKACLGQAVAGVHPVPCGVKGGANWAWRGFLLVTYTGAGVGGRG